MSLLTSKFMEALWVRKSFSAAGHTSLVYDYLLTLQDEHTPDCRSVTSGMPPGRSLKLKVLFLLNRYGNLIGQTFIQLEEAGLLIHGSQVFCQRFAVLSTCVMFLSTESIHILVLLCVWAIWGTRKTATKILILSYMSYVLSMLGVSVYGINNGHKWLRSGSSISISRRDSDLRGSNANVLMVRQFKDYVVSGDTLGNFRVFIPLISSMCSFEMQSYFLLTAYSDSPKYFLGKGFASPLLSVADPDQCLVLNLRGLTTRTYSTRELSREVDRQLEAFADADSACGGDMNDLEGERD
ncbi:uncharacterized protein EDB91DRAFT_1083565 [Suillus paluster]|uniref:uncharacterized protein n=1 Tax=Suillus paluster TaxID=48578 RepID=UPI001B87E5E6|nr:uncharacterized protein EDB91DRAFT_1083565 [Suillus paluster]KAG1735940.1 hypothetical protein EDB91DRAFT_1083565 [Suillus paluster]